VGRKKEAGISRPLAAKSSAWGEGIKKDRRKNKVRK